MTDVTTLAGRIAAAKAQLDDVYREVRAITEAAAMYEPDVFGEAGETSLLEVIDSLSDANRALLVADEPIAAAEWHARKLGI